MPNFNMKIAANELVDKKSPVIQLDVPGVVQPIAVDTLGDIGVITPNKVSACVLEVPEAFEAPSGQNGDISLDTNSTFGKAYHKHKDGGYEPGRAEEIFQEEFGPAIDQEGGEYKYGRSVEFREACHQ